MTMATYNQAAQSDEPFIEEVAMPPSSKLWRRFGLMAGALSIAVVVGLIWRHPSTPMQQMQISSTALLDDITASLPHGMMQQMHDQHNLYRCMHGLPNLAWDEGIAAKAQAYADKGNYAHSSHSDRENNGESCGENLAWGYPHLHGDTAAKDWYQEIQFTSPYGQVTGMDDSTPVGKPVGHYTQLVWRATTKIGCGMGPANVQGKTGEMWVCQYCTAGNSAGRFEQNVPAPIKSPTMCDGSRADVPSNFPEDLSPGLGDDDDVDDGSHGSSGDDTTTTTTTTGVDLHKKCGGGDSYTGPTECKAPYACKELSPHYSECQEEVKPDEYYMMEAGSCCCPDHQKIFTADECKKAIDALKLEHSTHWISTHKHVPAGCSWRDPSKYPGHESMHFFRVDGPEQGRFDLSPICKA